MVQIWSTQKMASLSKRKTAKRKIRWHVHVRVNGYPTQTKTFKRKDDADYWANKTENALKDGKTPKTRAQKSITIADVINEFIDEQLPIKSKGKNNKELTRQLRWWEKELGNVALLKLEPTMLRKAKKKLSVGRAAGTVNRYLAAISSCMKYCVKETDYGLSENPLGKVSRLNEPPNRGAFPCITRNGAYHSATCTTTK